MTRIEIGKSISGKDLINVISVGKCDNSCLLFGGGNEDFKCMRYNGNVIIEAKRGITKNTISEVRSLLKCRIS